MPSRARNMSWTSRKRSGFPYTANADRLASVSKSHPGLVAQQEVDDAQGTGLGAGVADRGRESRACKPPRAMLDEANAHLERDKALFDYARITAPFDGVVTQRYANQGALMQAGTSSSTHGHCR